MAIILKVTIHKLASQMGQFRIVQQQKNRVEVQGSKGTDQNNYTRTGLTFRVGGGGGFSETPPIFEHYKQHVIGFKIWLDTGIFR